jgi:hypothetical protein
MTEIPENLQPENWHRYFAIYANNAAWNMSESLENVLNHTELLDAAHASAWHWRVAGATINQMRSTMLKARSCLEAIQDPEDRAVVMKTFNLIPNV